jgi:hypothetical protein
MDKTYRRLNYLYEKIVWPLYYDSNKDHKNTVFIAGTERSGTTWVSDLINYKREYRYIFEPFWALRVPECHGFKSHQYIRENNCDTYYLKSTEAILSGRIRNKWTDQYHRKFIASKRLIKDIRANLFLKWMKVNFPDIKIIFLMRHPCAVARSFFRRQRNYSYLKPFLEQKLLVNDYLRPHINNIENISSDFEAIIYSWCIQNFIPLKTLKRGEMHVVFYERLCESPKSEIDILFNYLKSDYETKIYKHIRKPSPQIFKESAIVAGGSLIDGWKDYFGKKEIKRYVEILHEFDLDGIYNFESMPNVDGLSAFIDNNELI